jgi:hypothetical protein
MSQPVVFISHLRIKEGKLKRFERYRDRHLTRYLPRTPGYAFLRPRPAQLSPLITKSTQSPWFSKIRG